MQRPGAGRVHHQTERCEEYAAGRQQDVLSATETDGGMCFDLERHSTIPLRPREEVAHLAKNFNIGIAIEGQVSA